MCGRYTLYTKKEALEERFHADMDEAYVPNYNVAPSQHMPIITETKPETIVLGHWGFLPHWAEGKESIRPMINARAEGITTKPFFREAFKKHRCLILADGFYEWKRNEKSKVPYRFHLTSDKPFAMAGVYSEITDEKGGKRMSYAIITTEANELMKPVHNRMPIILNKNTEALWVDLSNTGEGLESLLKPYSGSDLQKYEVSQLVNKPENNTAEIIQSQSI